MAVLLLLLLISVNNGRRKTNSPRSEKLVAAFCKFALHVQVEKSTVEVKGKLSVIRSIRRKTEDSVKGLSTSDEKLITLMG